VAFLDLGRLFHGLEKAVSPLSSRILESKGLTVPSGSSERQLTPIGPGSPNVPLILLAIFPGLRLKPIPTALSDDAVLSPSICLNHPGLAALAHALITDEEPKAVMLPQTRPAAPLLPSMRSPAVLLPMRVVKAAISMRPFPKLRIGGGTELFMSWNWRREIQEGGLGDEEAGMR